MTFRIIILMTTLLSEGVYASQGLNTLGKEFTPKVETVVQVKNMPRVRSQDSVGLCYSFVAATLMDHANCVARNVADCESVPDEQKASPLDLARFSKHLPDDADHADRFNYEGINEGGSELLALHNAINSGSVVKESCAPFDQLVAKVDSPAKAQEMELAMWKRFRDSYESYQKKYKDCADCGLEYATAKGDELKENFNLKASNQDILEAFAQDTYSKFLDRLLVPDQCWDFKNGISLKGSWKIGMHPKPGEKSNYDKMLTTIKDQLKAQRPVSLGFCTQTPLTVKSLKACGSVKDAQGKEAGFGHSVVIKGYRRVCNSKNQCYDAVQVQNSWGQSWQNANDDGWVDAKVLLDRTFYEPQSVGWLEPAN